MKKARDIWFHRRNKNVIGDYVISDTKPLDVESIHFREVLDPDPKDEIIKTMRDALKNTFDCLPDELARPKNFCREALAAVDKLEKDK
jgi:hypothetical protein